jgi:hypothetical protein
VSLVPLTPFFPEVLNFAHRGFAVRGGFQERNPNEQRGCAVYIRYILLYMLDSKLYFHSHVDYVHSQGLRILGLIRYITYNFSS